MPRKKINKAIQKSISLTEQDWAIIEKLGESKDMSNSAVVREMLTAYMFIADLMENDIKLRIRFWDYYNEAIIRKERSIFKNPKDEQLWTLIDECFPKVRAIEELRDAETIKKLEEQQKLENEYSRRIKKYTKERFNK